MHGGWRTISSICIPTYQSNTTTAHDTVASHSALLSSASPSQLPCEALLKSMVPMHGLYIWSLPATVFGLQAALSMRSLSAACLLPALGSGHTYPADTPPVSDRLAATRQTAAPGPTTERCSQQIITQPAIHQTPSPQTAAYMPMTSATLFGAVAGHMHGLILTTSIHGHVGQRWCPHSLGHLLSAGRGAASVSIHPRDLLSEGTGPH